MVIPMIECSLPVRYNVRYGRSTATDEEVEEAARIADIHDRILSFPDGISTSLAKDYHLYSATDRAAVQPRPQSKPTLTDFDLLLYSYR